VLHLQFPVTTTGVTAVSAAYGVNTTLHSLFLYDSRSTTCAGSDMTDAFVGTEEHMPTSDIEAGLLDLLDAEAQSALQTGGSITVPYLCVVLHRQLDRQPALASVVDRIARIPDVLAAAAKTASGTAALARLRARILAAERYADDAALPDALEGFPYDVRPQLRDILLGFPHPESSANTAAEVDVVFADGCTKRVCVGQSVVLQDMATDSSGGAARLQISEEDADCILAQRFPSDADEARLIQLLLAADYLNVPCALNALVRLL
jgi:hypothetical protein